METHDLAAGSELELLISMLEATTLKWRRELGKVRDAFVGRPAYPGGHNIGALILHMTESEAWWVEHVSAGRKMSKEERVELMEEETRQYAGRWPAPPKKPLEHFYAIQDRVRARTIETVRALGDPAHAGKYGKEHEFTLRWVLHHVIQHEAYHGGQAVLAKALAQKAARRPSS